MWGDDKDVVVAVGEVGCFGVFAVGVWLRVLVVRGRGVRAVHFGLAGSVIGGRCYLSSQRQDSSTKRGERSHVHSNIEKALRVLGASIGLKDQQG